MLNKYRFDMVFSPGSQESSSAAVESYKRVVTSKLPGLRFLDGVGEWDCDGSYATDTDDDDSEYECRFFFCACHTRGRLGCLVPAFLGKNYETQSAVFSVN